MQHPLNKHTYRGLLILSLFLLWGLMTSCAERAAKPPDFPRGVDYEDYLYLKDRIKKNPDNMETYLYLGESCIMLRKLEEAEDCFEKAIKINPNRKDLRLNFAKTFRGIGLNRDAEAEEAMAVLLPEYDIYNRLRFSYP